MLGAIGTAAWQRGSDLTDRRPRIQFAYFAFFLTISLVCNYRLWSLSALPAAFDARLAYAGVLVFGALLFNGGSRLFIVIAACAGLFALGFDSE
jgi:hypothetical protein